MKEKEVFVLLRYTYDYYEFQELLGVFSKSPEVHGKEPIVSNFVEHSKLKVDEVDHLFVLRVLVDHVLHPIQ